MRTCLVPLLFGGILAQVTASANIPLGFELNRGQADDHAAFVTRTTESVVFVKKDGFRFVSSRTSTALDLRWIHGNVHQWSPGKLLPGVSNYLRGRQSILNVPHYSEIRGIALFRDVDVRLHETGSRFEFDFEVAAGGDPSQIEWTMSAAPRIENGDLVSGEFRLKRPEAWQIVDGQRRLVEVSYRIQNGTVGFQLGAWDRALPLVIDPTVQVVISPLSYVGGIGQDEILDMAVNSAGEIFVAGSTTTPDVIASRSPARTAAFVSKLNPAGTAVLYTTFLDGSLDDVANALAVDASGNVAVAGSTASTNFPRRAPSRPLWEEELQTHSWPC